MKDFLPLFLSRTIYYTRLNTTKLIPVLAYYLKPIKDGYPNLVIPTVKYITVVLMSPYEYI